MKRYSWLLIPLILQTGCFRHSGDESHALGEKGASFTSYATGYEVSDYGSYQLLRVFDPWQNSKGVIFSYVLAAKREMVPDSLSQLTFIQTPVQRVITLSTTHVAMIAHLNMEHTIVGVSGTRYIYHRGLRERINNNELPDVGYDQGLNYETIVSLNPDVLFMYGVEGNLRSISEKLADLGISVVFCGDYLEPYPLGKAEWIRFFSLFFGLEKKSDHIFYQIDSSYCALTAIAGQALIRPRVLTGLPWKDTWYMAGGQSFAARLIGDAGGDFLWNDNPSSEAIPLDLESVYARAVEADIWINPGAADNLDELNQFDERFTALPVLQRGQVYNNNNRLSDSGGNDYWESGAVRPDLVLADLIKVFHPDLMTDHPFIYYRKLK